MSECGHKRQVFIPHEDDPTTLLQQCTDCGEFLGTTDRTDLAEIGDSLGDPDPDI